ncbi:MAG: hypothetical protein JW751_11525 [Polyangiaceae bacterium]|nr:hypothetical protein [Polyangiaceae bacterium]
MGLTDIEDWGLAVIERSEKGHPIEDSRVKLEEGFPADDIGWQKWARRIAGHANAARGEPVLWLVGVNDKRGSVSGVRASDAARWWPRMRRYFDGVAPRRVDLAVLRGDVTVMALWFETARAPFVARHSDGDVIAFEVPSRDGTSVRTPRREDLRRLLAPRARLPIGGTGDLVGKDIHMGDGIGSGSKRGWMAALVFTAAMWGAPFAGAQPAGARTPPSASSGPAATGATAPGSAPSPVAGREGAGSRGPNDTAPPLPEPPPGLDETWQDPTPAVAPPPAVPASAPPPPYIGTPPPPPPPPEAFHQREYVPSPDEYYYSYPYRPGEPVPPGYHVETRGIRGLAIAGAITFGVSYLGSVVWAPTARYLNWLGVPVVGPFVSASRVTDCEDAFVYDDSGYAIDRIDDDECVANPDSMATLLRFDGIVQGAGIAMFAVGTFARRHRLVRNLPPVALRIVPYRLGRRGYALGVTGRF